MEIESKIKQVKQEAVELKKEFFEQSLNWILAGFGLVAALAWNEAIKSLVDILLGPSKASLWAKFIYAILATLLVVFLSKKLSRLIQSDKE